MDNLNQKSERSFLEKAKSLISEISSEMNKMPEKEIVRLDAISDSIEKKELDQKPDVESLTKAKEAKFKLADVVLPLATETEIRESLIKVNFHNLIYKEWGFEKIDPVGKGCVLNFYGPPGTGKSRGAEALAGELNLPFLKVDLAELESKFMGETAKNLCAVFKEAQETGALLFFDEADTVLGKRLSSVTQGVDAEINMTRSTMLIEMDNFTGVLVFASNFPENYDAAFRRRISHHIHFQLPDHNARSRLWDMHLVSQIPLVTSNREQLLTDLADLTEGFSGGYVLQAMRLALPMAVNTISPSESELTSDHLFKSIDLVKRSMREVGSDVNERLTDTREMFGIKKAESNNQVEDQEIIVSHELIESHPIQNEELS